MLIRDTRPMCAACGNKTGARIATGDRCRYCLTVQRRKNGDGDGEKRTEDRRK